MKKGTTTLFARVQGLVSEIHDIKIDCNNSAQYSRRDTLEIAGIPVCKDEDTNDIVCNIGKLVDVDIEDDDISVSHRLPGDKYNNSHVPAIIVKFVRRDLRDELYKARKSLSGKSTRDIGILRHPQQNIYINESLTPQNRALYKQCLKAKRELHYKFIWTKYGKIHLRKNNSSPSVNISSPVDIKKLYENDNE
jgi:hypothetical protein